MKSCSNHNTYLKKEPTSLKKTPNRHQQVPKTQFEPALGKEGVCVIARSHFSTQKGERGILPTLGERVTSQQ